MIVLAVANSVLRPGGPISRGGARVSGFGDAPQETDFPI
jgi:hypothetical protein